MALIPQRDFEAMEHSQQLYKIILSVNPGFTMTQRAFEAMEFGQQLYQLYFALATPGAVHPAVAEVNLGATPVISGTFDITGLSGLVPGAPVQITQAAGPYTGKGTLPDEAEQQVLVTGYVLNATTIRAYWDALGKFVQGNFKFQYTY